MNLGGYADIIDLECMYLYMYSNTLSSPSLPLCVGLDHPYD